MIDIARQLEDWAAWSEPNPYASDTAVDRARSGQIPQHQFGPQTPRGTPDRKIALLDKVITAELDAKINDKQVRAACLCAKFGPKRAREILGCPDRTLRDWRYKGERVLVRRLEALA